MLKVSTECCALCQLRANNYTSVLEIQQMVKLLKKQAQDWFKVGDKSYRGQRAAYVIVSPGEDILEENLIYCGFKQIAEFDRRIGYPQTGMLKMYFLNW